MNPSNAHFHKDELGTWRRCYHQCRHWLSPGFLAGFLIYQTLLFPLEHLQWDHVWPFNYVGHWLDTLGSLQMWIAYLWVFTWIVLIVWSVIHSAKKDSV
jgi:hypothetical protein